MDTARSVHCALFKAKRPLKGEAVQADCFRLVLLARGEPGAPAIRAAVTPLASAAASVKLRPPTWKQIQPPTEATVSARQAESDDDDDEKDAQQANPPAADKGPTGAAADSADAKAVATAKTDGDDGDAADTLRWAHKDAPETSEYGEWLPRVAPMFFAHRDYFDRFKQLARSDFDDAGEPITARPFEPHIRHAELVSCASRCVAPAANRLVLV